MQTLERLHAELEEAQRLAGQMPHVEAVIKMQDPSYNMRRIAVKRWQPNPGSSAVLYYRRAVDSMRTATEPLTAREIAERVLAAANVANPNKEAVADLTGSVLASLRNHNE